MVLEDENSIYRITIDLLIGVIVGVSFQSVGGVFIPLSGIFNLEQLTNAAAVVLGYFIVISGWISYHRSVTSRPHLGFYGTIRYMIDLVILFLWYYIVMTSGVELESSILPQPEPLPQYGELFLWVLPSLFLLYMIWDIVKYYEYLKQPESIQVKPKRMISTLRVGLVFYGLSVIYFVISSIFASQLDRWDNKTSMDLFFIIASGVINLYYRLEKRTRVATKKFT